MNYAGFFRRFAASLIDGLILILPILIIGGSLQNAMTGFGVGFILAFLYKPIFESSILSATPGKALMGVVVVSESGDRLTFKQAAIRFFSSYISMIIGYIGYLMQPFTSKRQTLHDMISESVVLRKESADLNYFIVWRNQLKEVFNKL